LEAVSPAETQVAFETTAGKTKGEHPTYKDMGEDQKKNKNK
jgi:hypothetical protein